MAVDIHALEIEFAKNPTLDACILLCDAYLANKRFMEAMVVCKKGIKAAPNDVRGRVMLARVYLDQGKAPKAEQEMQETLKAFPAHPQALIMLAEVLIKQNRGQEAAPLLQQTLAADPNSANARRLAQTLGMPVPAVAVTTPPGMPQTLAATPPPMNTARSPSPAQFSQPAGFRPAPAQMPMQQPGFAPQQPPPMQYRPGPMPTGVPFGQPFQAAPPMNMAGAPGMAQQQPVTQPTWGQQQVAPTPPATVPPKLEHVSDFFDQETLGFKGDASSFETAGPGRLTILNFVPKSTGSVKTTVFVFLGLMAVVALLIVWQSIRAQNTRKLNKYYGEIKTAIDEDKYARYLTVLKIGQEALKVDSEHNQVLSALAYTEAVLGVDHRVDGAIENARQYLQRAKKASAKDDTEYRVAAEALLAYADGRFDEGIKTIKRIQEKGGTGALVEMEAFRLMYAAHPDDKETQKQLARLVQSVVYQPRAYVALGWYYYRIEDYTKADKYFDEANKNSKDHSEALLGQAINDLDRNIGIDERQKEIGDRIKKVFALPNEDISVPIRALAYFARSQLLLWQKKTDESLADYQKAIELDSKNIMFIYARGQNFARMNRYKEAIDLLRKAAAAAPNNALYLKALGVAQSKTGDSQGAAASFKRASELAANDYELAFFDAERLRGDKQWDAALKRYNDIPASAASPDLYIQAQVGMSKIYRETKQPAKSIAQLTALLTNAPKGVQPPALALLWCELGQAYETTKNNDKAIQVYTVGIEQYPLYADCHFFMCRAMDRRDPEMKEACKRYLKVDPRGEYVEEAERRINMKGGGKR